MNRTLIVLGLDSADPKLLDVWMDRGALPNIKRLREQGAYCSLRGPDLYLSEQAWTLVTTGFEATSTGYWSRWQFDPRTYELRDAGAYDFDQFPPFYALGPTYRSALFDVPQTRKSDRVNGVQIFAWGARSARTTSSSEPPDLLTELVQKHGRHPAFDRDHASYWNPIAVTWLERALRKGIARRTEICLDLLKRKPWNLFFTVFGETHSAGHFLWHLSQEHPLYRWKRTIAGDPLQRVFQDVDRSIGEILTARPDADVVVFSPEGMEANSVDLPSTVFLPELLYRLSCGPAAGLADGGVPGVPPPSVGVPNALGWYRHLYALRSDHHPIRRHLRRWLPIELSERWERVTDPGQGPGYPASFGGLFHQPPMWYSRLWPGMKAFALPSISHGYIRINVRGRERDGIVDPSLYGRFCDELTGHLLALRDARSGLPVVQNVVRPRTSPLEAGRHLPDADLVVFYHSRPVDVVDSPSVGRIGPVPYARTGGHTNRGFAIIRAPGCSPGSVLQNGHVRDLAPTFLSLLGAPASMSLGGTSLMSDRMDPPSVTERTVLEGADVSR